MNREETLALYNQGTVTWNQWAEEMLAEKAKLKEAGKWAEERDQSGSLEPKSDDAEAWFENVRADFSGYTFEEEANFTGFIFPGAAYFGIPNIFEKIGKSNIHPALFKEKAWFVHTLFGGRADFEKAQFHKAVVFDNVNFNKIACFAGCQFSEDARFSEINFHDHASFKEVIFENYVEFNQSKFASGADFDGARFDKTTRFNDLQFNMSTSFGGVIFEENAPFNKVVFTGNASFAKAYFKKMAGFTGVAFKRDADFGLATFKGLANFREARFEDVEFSTATFESHGLFSAANFNGPALFGSAMFKGNTTFRNAAFHSTADFSAISGGQAFDLEGTEFKQLPDFRQAHFITAPDLDRSFIQHGDASVHDTASKFRALKKLAIDGHDHEQELIFFSGELRAKRSIIGKLYWFFSDFGRSLLRPALSWFCCMIFFSFFYLSQHFSLHNTPYPANLWSWLWPSVKSVLPGLKVKSPDISCIAGRGDPLGSAFYLSSKKAMLALGWDQSENINQAYACLYGVGVGYKVSETIPVIPFWVNLWLPFQAVLSAVFVFLFLLAVRNQFRIK